jgi:serine/threonine protein kinase
MADCPGHEELQKLISDPPAPEREQSLERHLETCEHCRQRLEALADLRDVVPDRPVRVRLPESPALKRAMEHFQADPNSQEAVVGVPALAGGSQSDWLKPGLQPTLPFLQPTDRPGFLGKLGPYELRRLIGRGGMGMVFEGFDPALKRTVAVKVMDPLLAMSDQARSRFLREARAAAALTHENIVTIHAVDQADSVLFVVLQYVSGESVADRLRREVRLPFADVVRLGVQVARGLAAAHEKGLVHRDIKPGNLLHEAGTDRVKIADFGLVKTAGEDALTVEGTIAGTPEFMSPEQARGTGVDARSDLFSLGAVLYTACTGMSPFRGDSPLHTLERPCRNGSATSSIGCWRKNQSGDSPPRQNWPKHWSGQKQP